jgi:hypothetical protein
MGGKTSKQKSSFIGQYSSSPVPVPESTIKHKPVTLPFESLPFDLQKYIFTQVYSNLSLLTPQCFDPRTLISLRVVSYSWRSFIDNLSDNIWKFFYAKQFPKQFKSIKEANCWRSEFAQTWQEQNITWDRKFVTKDDKFCNKDKTIVHGPGIYYDALRSSVGTSAL